MNPHLRTRIEAIHQQLLAAHRGGRAMSNATRGSEREVFVDLLLRGCLPHPFRFGAGEVTDAHGAISGQLDLVIEHAFYPSFPMLGTSQHRLYLIEGVAIAIEVKSSQQQFGEAVETMRKLLALNHRADWPRDKTLHPFASPVSATGGNYFTSFPSRVGFAVVLYRGWSTAKTLSKHANANDVDVVLQLNPPIFYARHYRVSAASGRQNPTPHTVEGPEALMAFICVVNDEIHAVAHSQSNIFRRYVEQRERPDAMIE